MSNTHLPNDRILNIPMNDKILNACNNVMNDYIGRHSKTFVMRIDIHPPEDAEQSQIIKFNKRFIEKERLAGNDPSYIVAREVSSSKKTHYHMALFLDGQKTNSTYKHFENAKTVLQNVMGPGGTINYCDDGHRNGIMINRNDPDPTNLTEAQRQVSYLAKTDQKQNVNGKTFFTSRIRK